MIFLTYLLKRFKPRGRGLGIPVGEIAGAISEIELIDR